MGAVKKAFKKAVKHTVGATKAAARGDIKGSVKEVYRSADAATNAGTFGLHEKGSKILRTGRTAKKKGEKVAEHQRGMSGLVQKMMARNAQKAGSELDVEDIRFGGTSRKRRRSSGITGLNSGASKGAAQSGLVI